MSRPTRFGFALFAVTIGAAALSSGRIAAEPEPVPVAKQVVLGADQVIAGRRAAFGLSAAAFASLRAVAEKGEKNSQAVLFAAALARWSKALPGLFPEGTQSGKTRALPAIWSDRGVFEATAGQYHESALRAVKYAQAGDNAALSAELAAMQKICASCHDRFRQPDPAPPPAGL